MGHEETALSVFHSLHLEISADPWRFASLRTVLVYEHPIEAYIEFRLINMEIDAWVLELCGGRLLLGCQPAPEAPGAPEEPATFWVWRL